MIRRFFASRGMRRLARNRWAMGATAVIALYVLLAGWVLVSNAVNDLGTRTGWWSLEDRPLLGMLLISKTAERVGPPQVAGLGMEQSLETRLNQFGFMLTSAEQAIRAAERAADAEAQAGAAPDGPVPESVLTPLREARLAERTLADLPLDALSALTARAQESFGELDDLTRRRIRLEEVSLYARTLADLLEAPPQSPPAESTALLDAVEDLGFALEEIEPALGGALVPGVDSARLLEAAALLFDEPSRQADLPSPAELRSLARAVVDRASALESQKEELAARIGAAIDELYPHPEGLAGAVYTLKMSLGTDRQGRSMLIRALYSAKIAVQVGFVTALIAVLLGTVLGAAAGFFGGWVDHAVIWLYSTFSSVPNLVLLVVLAFMFTGSPVDGTLIPLYAAFCLTFWIGPCRVIRGETLKLKELEYVQAATAIGFNRPYILLRHLIPNTFHLMFINFSLLFIGAIKSEVILTFLGLGLKSGASWGIMIAQSEADVVAGFFWQIGTATTFMFLLVLAFNIFTDALQDAFDPKHVG